MALITCPFGHYYDDERNTECPVCRRNEQKGESVYDMQSQVTVSGYKLGSPNGNVTELLSSDDLEASLFGADAVENQYDAMADENSTIGFFEIEGIGGYTAGWLVCVDGPDKGRSFTIVVGRNLCGNSAESDICLSDPELVPRMHCSVIYEPKEIKFYITPENGAVFYNGKFINKPTLLKSGDRINIGSSELIFVPFCNKNRSWNV